MSKTIKDEYRQDQAPAGSEISILDGTGCEFCKIRDGISLTFLYWDFEVKFKDFMGSKVFNPGPHQDEDISQRQYEILLSNFCWVIL